MPNRTVSVALRAQVDHYVTGMKKAAAVTKDMEVASKKSAQATEVMGKVATVVGAYAAFAFGKQIVKAASDMNETMQKSTVVFGQNAKAVQDWSKNSATSMGMSSRAALEAAATYGNLFVSIGLGKDVSADMSMRLVQLAADLASFNNTDPAEALDALRSGLVGEIEPLRRFGVNLNDAELREKALSMGLVKTTKEVLPPAVRTQAAYALVLERTGTAQGDFARTADGLANSQRTLNAVWEDAKEALGQDLLPAATSVAQGLTGVLRTVSEMPAPVRDTALAVAALSAAALILGPRLLAAKMAMDAGSISIGGLIGGLGRLAPVMAAAFVGEEIIRQMHNMENLRREVELTVTALQTKADAKNIEALRNQYKELSDFLNNPSLWDQARVGIEYIGNLGHYGNEFDKASDAAKQAGAAYAALSGTLAVVSMDMTIGLPAAEAALVASGIAVTDNIKGNVDALEAWIRAHPRAVAAMQASTTVADEVVRSAKDMATGWYDAEGKLVSLTERMKAMNDPAHALVQAQMDSIDASRTLAESFKKNGRSLDENTEKGEANKRAVLGRVDAILSEAAAMESSGTPAEKVRGWLINQKQALENTITAFIGSRTAAHALVEQLLKIPPRIPIEVVATIKPINTGDFVVNIKSGGRASIDWEPDSSRQRHAAGGPIHGPGTSTSDDIPAWLSNGEWVVNAEAVRRVGPAFLDALNRGKVAHLATGTTMTLAQQQAYRWQAQLDTIHYLHDSGQRDDNYTIRALTVLLTWPGSTLADRRSVEIELVRLKEEVARAAAEKIEAQRQAAEAAARAEEERRQAAQAAAEAQARAAQEAAEAAARAEEERRAAAEAAFQRSFNASTFESVRSNASLMESFDVRGQEEATRNLITAQENLAAARAKVNAAGSPKDVIAAIRERVDAEQELAAAIEARAKAEPTGANILAQFQGRAAKASRFAADLGTLAKRGLSPMILQEILAAGIDEGGAMAAALVQSGDIVGLNATQNWINSISANLAQWSAIWAQQTANAPKLAAAGQQAWTTGDVGSPTATFAIAIENAAQPVVLQMDSEAIWRGLLSLKASRGGATLGIG